MKKNATLPTLVILIISVFKINTTFGQADTTNLEYLSLKELLNVKVTTASRTSQSLGLTPASIVLITKEQIKIRGYRSLLDALYDLPDMKVDDKIYPGIRNSFTLRGTQGSEKFIILLDGTPVSSPSGEALPIMENYPVNLAEQIEVIYGPASALYGANAVSAVINIITRKAKTKQLKVDASSMAGTYGYTNTSLYIAKKFNKQVSFTLSGQYSYDKQPDYSKLYKEDSLYNIASYSTGTFNTMYGPINPATPVKPKFEAPMQAFNIFSAIYIGDLAFSFFNSYSKTPSSFSNNTSNAIYNKEAYIAQNVSTTNVSYRKKIKKFISATSFTLSEYNLNSRSNYRNLYTALEPAYKYSMCSMVKAEELLTYNRSENLSFTAGVGYEKYTSVAQSADLDKPVNKNDYVHGIYAGTRNVYRPEGLPAQFYLIRFNNIGAYFQTQYAPHEKVHLTIGTRYDVNSRYGHSLNPRLGIVYKPLNRTTIKLLYGSAFRAPTPSDSYSQYGTFDTHDSGRTYHSHFLHLPNPGLKPTKSYNTELSIQQYLTENFSITIDAYYTSLSGLPAFADDNESTRLYNNMFNNLPVDYIQVFVNKNRQKNYGGSLKVNWKHAVGNIHLNSYASFSYVNGVIKNAGQEGKDVELDFISPYMAHAGTDIKAGRFSCSPRIIIMGRQNLTGIKDPTARIIKRQTIAGYTLLNISARFAATEKISFFSIITNALNQEYKNVGFNMDLTNTNTDIFHGQRQDPVRIMAGCNLSF